ncbi:hypothetical protein SAMN05216489_00140 [Streptomyces sp. 3213]|nr:hypothetical protein SAMN05216489_00140 [Streptomyces sp. 3213] [Streptomyces sp. 3213.3]
MFSGVDNRESERKDYGVTLTDLSEREYFVLFAKRTGMYIGDTSLRGTMAFLAGYEQAARRYGGPGLDGWREWLMAHHQVSSNLVWEAQVMQIAFPGWDGGWDLTTEREDHALKLLFELLDKFLTEREEAASGAQQ